MTWQDLRAFQPHYDRRDLPEWSPHWCVTPGCQHMPAMGHDCCCCCEDADEAHP